MKKKQEARVAKATQRMGKVDAASLVLKVKDLAQTAGGLDKLKALVLAD